MMAITKEYIIEGMTCQNCKSKVEQVLTELKDVEEVDVNLEQKKAKIRMTKSMLESDLQKAISPKYTIKRIKQDALAEVPTHKDSKLSQLKPLFLILGYISIASFVMNRDTWNEQEIMFDFMGLFFIVFSFFKMLDVRGFSNSFKMYDPLAKMVPVYGRVYPFVETVLGLMFLMRWQLESALILTLILLGITTVGVSQTLLAKRSIKCACLGTALNLPMTEATIVENVIMIAMSVLMLTAM